MNDKEMLNESIENSTAESLDSTVAINSEKSNDTDSQVNIEASVETTDDAPVKAKKPRKSSSKPKVEETDAIIEADDDAPVKAKKPRKSSSKSKVDETDAIIEADDDKHATAISDDPLSDGETAYISDASEEFILPDTGISISGEVSFDIDAALPHFDDASKDEAVNLDTAMQDDKTAAEDIVDSTQSDVSSENKDTVIDTNEPIIPHFPESTYVGEEASDDSAETAEEETEEESESIIPPDEIFAIRLDTANTVEDAADDENAETALEAPVNDEGQYVIPELEVQDEDGKSEYFEEPTPEEYDPKKPRKIDARFDLVELIVFTLLAVMIITSFFFRHSIVQGDSMKNTLHDGEHLIISDFLYEPERGDVVVCQDHTAKLNTPIVKRIIAVGGDDVKITPTSVYVNGELLDEDYVFIDPFAMPYRYVPMEITVPEGEVFVMGDHRNNSKDSRDLIELGTVSEDAILGKVLLRFYPFSEFGTID